MKNWLADEKRVLNFSKPDSPPTALHPDESTTVLSPYLKFGCLSVRTFYHSLKSITNGKKATMPPVSLEGQLLWREFFYTVSFATPGFDKMETNPMCIQVSWRPYNGALLTGSKITRDEARGLDRKDPGNWPLLWEHALTGFPWIDACMMQLSRQGWLHHLARHAVACFLTRGDLYVHWEAGRDVFDRLLLDADWALNNANWLWLSASAFFHQYYRVYGPVSFPKHTDKDGAYVRYWLPELRGFPPAFIYEPWQAPLAVQRAAGCILGKDYPLPLVDHDSASKVNIAAHKAAYAKKSYGVAQDCPSQPLAKRKKTE
jgi:cryptochrome